MILMLALLLGPDFAELPWPGPLDGLRRAGPWDIEVPIEGMTGANEPNLVPRIADYFKTLKDLDGKPCAVAASIRKGSGFIRLTMDCPMDGIALSHLAKALEGTAWSLKPEAWTLFGRVGFRWADARLTDEQERALERDLAKHCRVADVMRVADGKTAAYVRFDDDATASAGDLLAVLARHGVKSPDIFWPKDSPNQPRRTLCGARRIDKAK